MSQAVTRYEFEVTFVRDAFPLAGYGTVALEIGTTMFSVAILACYFFLSPQDKVLVS